MLKNIGKTLLILPIAIYPFVTQLYADPVETGVTELLVSCIFGQVTDGNFTNLFFVVGKMMYLLVFHLLFGTCISKYFVYMSSYYFSRIDNRCVWFLKQCLCLIVYAGVYAFFYLSSSLVGCCLISAQKADQKTWRIFWILFWICFVVIIMTTLIINMGIIILKSGIGFLICWMGIIFLTAIAIRTADSPVVSFCNPMSYFCILNLTRVEMCKKFLYLFSLLGCMIAGAMVFLKNYDVTLREVN